MKCPRYGSEIFEVKRYENEVYSRIVNVCLKCGNEEKIQSGIREVGHDVE